MRIGRKEIGLDKPVYFIADIASNHDGSLERAERLIYLAAEAGADAVKFQNFKAETIVSDYGFKQLGKQSHQAQWKGSVFEVYKRFETPVIWAPTLKMIADNAGVDYITTPYDPYMVDFLDMFVCAFKVGSGDITYLELIDTILDYDKPILIGTGASTIEDVYRVLKMVRGRDVVLMQCNTNYEGGGDNFPFINLKVLCNWWQYSGDFVLGLSDHTPGHATVLGAVALAAKVIEKHFTDDNAREGPDHGFALNPVTWRTMVDRTRELESALSGDGMKKVEENEKETFVLQRRSIRAGRDLLKDKIIEESDITYLRPCPPDGLPPYAREDVVGLATTRDIAKGECLNYDNLTSLFGSAVLKDTKV